MAESVGSRPRIHVHTADADATRLDSFVSSASAVCIGLKYAAKVVLFSVVPVCVCVCLSVNTITPEPLEISSRNFQGIILWFKGQIHSKWLLWGAQVVRKSFWCSSTVWKYLSYSLKRYHFTYNNWQRWLILMSQLHNTDLNLKYTTVDVLSVIFSFHSSLLLMYNFIDIKLIVHILFCSLWCCGIVDEK